MKPFPLVSTMLMTCDRGRAGSGVSGVGYLRNSNEVVLNQHLLQNGLVWAFPDRPLIREA